jgi:hypothetical protein
MGHCDSRVMTQFHYSFKILSHFVRRISILSSNDCHKLSKLYINMNHNRTTKRICKLQVKIVFLCLLTYVMIISRITCHVH